MLPLRARVDLGVMAMKGYSAFPKARNLLKNELLTRLLSDVWNERPAGELLYVKLFYPNESDV